MALTASASDQRHIKRRRKGSVPLARALAAGTVAALSLTGCLGPSGSARVSAADASGDGTLRIGLILDNTGQQNFLNAPQLAAAKLAVQDINAAGGHKGKPVELLPETISTDTAAQAEALVGAKADVVIGPTDSSRAPAAIDVLANARVAVISPANTAGALSNYKSNGYYFRTSASDVAQASVLAKLAKDGGARTVAVLHEEGGYGKEVAAAVADAAKQSGLDAVADAEFTGGQAQQAVDAVKAANPDAVVLVAREGAQGAIAELNNAGLAGKKLILSDGAVSPYGSGVGARALDGTRAILPGVYPSAAFQTALVGVDPGLKDMVFAAETYDAVILAALAAAAADDDAGTSIAASLVAVSGGDSSDGAMPTGQPAGQPSGQPASQGGNGPVSKVCVNYKDCVDALRAGQRPDYDGQSGRINFDAHGDVTEANYMVYTYGEDNLATMTGTETAGSSNGGG